MFAKQHISLLSFPYKNDKAFIHCINYIYLFEQEEGTQTSFLLFSYTYNSHY